jgi:hypothetical protein
VLAVGETARVDVDPETGDQRYVYAGVPPEAFAVSVILPGLHNVLGPVIVTLGVGFTVMVTVATAVTELRSVTVTV